MYLAVCIARYIDKYYINMKGNYNLEECEKKNRTGEGKGSWVMHPFQINTQSLWNYDRNSTVRFITKVIALIPSSYLIFIIFIFIWHLYFQYLANITLSHNLFRINFTCFVSTQKQILPWQVEPICLTISKLPKAWGSGV